MRVLWGLQRLAGVCSHLEVDVIHKVKRLYCSMINVSEKMSEKRTSYQVDRTRYNGRVKKRRWEETPRSNTENYEAKETEPFQRIKKKKVAMLLAYSGRDYYGMQRNPTVRSIEEDLHKALLTANYINQEAYDQMQVVQYQRAARTDKGVSAAGQVVSLKMPETFSISEINEHLPSVIKLFAIKRVTKGFNSKNQCDARTYTYLLPTYSFEKHETVVENILEYRTTPEIIKQVNEVLKKFEGTHNFHNFTSKKHFIDPSAKRFIMYFECSEPFVVDGMEFATIKVKGQSFMLHQIRKMVGLSLAIIRGITSDSVIEKAWESDSIDIPTAPGLGLVLDQVHYDRYNTRYGKDGFHEPLEWTEVEDEVKAFKEKFIQPTIISTEINDKPMESFLTTLSWHSYDVREGKNITEDKEETNEFDLDSDDEVVVTKSNSKQESSVVDSKDIKISE